MARDKILDENGDGHFGYGELLKPATVDALISQHNEHAEALDLIDSGKGVQVTDSTLTGVVSDYEVPSDATDICLVLESGDVDLTGIEMEGGWTDGRELELHNWGTTNSRIVIYHANETSDEENRFALPSDKNWVISKGCSAKLRYNATEQRLKLTALSGRSFPGLNVEDDLQIVTAQTAGSGVVFGTGGPKILSGPDDPEEVYAAPVGSLFLRINGGADTTLYVKESGTGNTGWVAK